MSYASTKVNSTSLVNAAGEKAVNIKPSPQKPVNLEKDNGTNKENLLPQLNLRELEMALTKAVTNTRFTYKILENIDMIVVKIIDRNTDEVIKEIPGEEIQKLHENLQEAIGLLFDTQI